MLSRKYVVKTQVLENYGSHCESGKYADGNHQWKFKFGDDYIVSDLNSPADALAFVAAITISNTIDYKEFPTTVTTYDEWLAELDNLECKQYSDHILESAIKVSPNDILKKEAA